MYILEIYTTCNRKGVVIEKPQLLWMITNHITKVFYSYLYMFGSHENFYYIDTRNQTFQIEINTSLVLSQLIGVSELFVSKSKALTPGISE